MDGWMGERMEKKNTMELNLDDSSCDRKAGIIQRFLESDWLMFCVGNSCDWWNSSEESKFEEKSPWMDKSANLAGIGWNWVNWCDHDITSSWKERGREGREEAVGGYTEWNMWLIRQKVQVNTPVRSSLCFYSHLSCVSTHKWVLMNVCAFTFTCLCVPVSLH